MSKPRYKWWGYIKNVIRAYPGLKQEYEALHTQNITDELSGMPKSGGSTRTVENIALKELPKPKQAEYEAVRQAVEGTKRLASGAERLKIINLVFWKQSHTLQGAALEAHISYDTAINYHGEFIRLVAYYRDLITYDEVKEKKRLP